MMPETTSSGTGLAGMEASVLVRESGAGARGPGLAQAVRRLNERMQDASKRRASVRFRNPRPRTISLINQPLEAPCSGRSGTHILGVRRPPRAAHQPEVRPMVGG